MNRHRLRSTAALGLALAAVTAPTAVAQQDLRSPDTRDATAAAGTQANLMTAKWQAYQKAVASATPRQLAASAGRGTDDAPAVRIVEAPLPASADDGIHWEDVGFGAGGLLALILLVGGTTYAIVHRRRGGLAGGQMAATR
jgi:hypothetical protein